MALSAELSPMPCLPPRPQRRLFDTAPLKRSMLLLLLLTSIHLQSQPSSQRPVASAL